MPDEVQVLYRWHNGATKAGYASVPRLPLESYEHALHNRALLDANIDENDTSGATQWGAPANWLPLISDGYSIVVDCRQGGPDDPLIRMTDPDF